MGANKGLTPSNAKTKQAKRTDLNNTVKQKQMDYIICVCCHQNRTKDGVTNFPLFNDDKPNDRTDH